MLASVVGFGNVYLATSGRLGMSQVRRRICLEGLEIPMSYHSIESIRELRICNSLR